MVIKVCGMRQPDNIRDVASLHPMLMGFIFHPGSPRDASELDPEVVRQLPAYIKPVGVFVDRPVDTMAATALRYGLQAVQLHGHETPAQCAEMRRLGLMVIKAVGVDRSVNWDDYAPYVGSVDLLLLDNKTPAHGGSGQKFDWSLLDSYPLAARYLLSGGIGPDDVDAIVSAMRPGLAGIDINSRFETAPGLKDINRLLHFILQLRTYNEE
jgi:phosphoribosylanthranilate isomerase